MNDVAIIDYKLGNLFSVQRVCKHVGLTSVITSDKKAIENSRGIIFPGVGSFNEAMKNLGNLDLIFFIQKLIKSGRAFMGICLGFQLLFSESEEFGKTQGLNIFNGVVKRFPANNKNIKVPQIGWNQIFNATNSSTVWENSIMRDVKNGEYMYFIHSFYVIPEDKELVLIKTNYEGIEYCSGIKHDNVYAFQFHPEKCADIGIGIFQNWANTIKQ